MLAKCIGNSKDRNAAVFDARSQRGRGSEKFVALLVYAKLTSPSTAAQVARSRRRKLPAYWPANSNVTPP